MPSAKQRLDARLLAEGHFVTGEKARAAIMAGLVYVDGQLWDKPGSLVQPAAQIQVRGKAVPFVSRGGLKLEKGIKSFGLDLRDKVVLDAGASTGGFTHCALEHGARLVYAVDVGYGQLDWSLRQDPRVVVLERTNIRYLRAEQLGERPQVATIDLSFISLTKVLAVVFGLLTADGEGIALIKPQFEAPRDKVGKKGLVRDPQVHMEVISRITEQIRILGKGVAGLDYSPLTGPAGNVEYLVYFAELGLEGEEVAAVVRAVVNEANLQFTIDNDI